MMNDALLTVADVMTPITVSATPQDTVAAAAKLISQHNLPAVPVLEHGRVAGLVTPLQLILAPPYRPIVEVMIPDLTPASPELPLMQAYALMTRQHLDVLPVVEDGTVVGLIAATTVLRRESQQNDPLTGLPAATALRSWAMAALERGHEVTILFVDLDNFGAVNKMLGHVAGDDILCSVSQLLSGLVDPRTDLLCRYGGDEFAIATLRNETGARHLIQRIQEVVTLPLNLGGEARHVTASVGIAGGRRAEGRKRSHIAATIDDLITLASRASTAAKEAKRSTGPASHRVSGDGAPVSAPMNVSSSPGAHREPRVQLMDVTVSTNQSGGSAAVTLRLGTHEAVGRATGPLAGQGSSYLVALAALDAIGQTAGEVHRYVLEELAEVPTGADRLVVVVLRSRSTTSQVFVGSARGVDLPRAVTKAILAALNRAIAKPEVQSTIPSLTISGSAG
jgi:IMP dehydrogenase